MAVSPTTRYRLDAYAHTGLNYDPLTLSEAAGYSVTDVRHALPSEAPGDPVPHGSFEIARRLISEYDFADPALVRASYDATVPLLGRTMVLQLRALGVISVHVGVRIIRTIDEEREASGRRVRIWGWTYGTLEGHVEAGEMSWETWKWLDTGEVEFRCHALSRPAKIRNPFVALGFKVLGPHERKTFLHGTGNRMSARIGRELAEQ
jgi:uncharacterized protein (UPF0548 family)